MSRWDRATDRLKRTRRAMAESAEHLSPFLTAVRFPVEANDFLVYELARLFQEGEPSLENPDFRFLIQQGIRLQADPSVRLRAEVAEHLRLALPGMTPALRRMAMEVIGGVEDIDLPLNQVGVIVQGYTRQLLSSLEEAARSDQDEAQVKEEIEGWKRGAIGQTTLCERLGELAEAALGPVSDWLCDSIHDSVGFEAALSTLSKLDTPGTGRVLAYLVSTPILDELQEERVWSMLKDRWPFPRNYMLYRLREHTHEDIPYRWFELLIETQDPRAVDLILEEVLVHGGNSDYREDLLAVLGLIERSMDPGRNGKIARLLTSEGVSREPVALMEGWVRTSSFAQPLERTLERRRDGHTILVSREQDLASFAARHADGGPEDVWEEWESAYHESLGWQRFADFPRGPMEKAFEQETRSTMLAAFHLTPEPDEALMRDRIETLRENWLITSRTGAAPLVRVLRERKRGNPWMEEIRGRDLNAWYIRAAQAFDEGRSEMARQYLDVLLEIEPHYPLGAALDRVMKLGE